MPEAGVSANAGRDCFHRAQRSQNRLQIWSFFTVKIDLVGAKSQTFNIRDLISRKAIWFHSGDDPFTPGGLRVFFDEARGDE